MTPRRVRSDSTRTARARSPSAVRRRRSRQQGRGQGQGDRRPSARGGSRGHRAAGEGKFSVRGSPDKGMTLAEAAGAAYVTMDMPEGWSPDSNEQSFFDPENFVFPFGAHACVVDVDAETGKVKVVRYVAVDDCGPAINPMLIDGQVHGGITHGIGQALYERIHYDEARAARHRHVRGLRAARRRRSCPASRPTGRETPSPVNSLGVKGVGEAGTIAASAGRHQRRDRRAAPARRGLHRHAALPDANLEGHSGSQGRCAGMIPAEFDYTAPGNTRRSDQALADGGEDAKPLAGGHSLLPLMKLPLGRALAARRPARGARSVTESCARTGAGRIGALTPHAELERRPISESWRHGGEDRRPASAQSRHDRRVAGARRSGLRSAGRAADLRRRAVTLQGAGGQRGAARRPVPRLPRDCDRAERGPDRGPDAGARRLGLRLPEVQPPQRGLGDGGASARSSSRAATSCEDVRIGLTNMALGAAQGQCRRGVAARPAAERGSIAQAAEQAAEEPIRPPT